MTFCESIILALDGKSCFLNWFFCPFMFFVDVLACIVLILFMVFLQTTLSFELPGFRYEYVPAL